MMLLVVFSAILSALIVLISTIPTSRNSIKSAIQSNMADLSTAYIDLLDKAVAAAGNKELSTQQLEEILSKVRINGVKSSFIFLVDQNGKMLYNPDTSRIGAVSTNSLVVDVTNAIKAGNYKKSDISQYVSTDGVLKYSSYAVSDKTHWTLIVTAEEKEILSPIRNITNRAILATIIVIIILSIIGYLLAASIINPIKDLTNIVKKTSDLDFTEDSITDKLCKRKDETGAISRMTVQMQHSLKAMILKIEQASDSLVINAENLHEVTKKIDDSCTDNSATSEQLAASMQETSATAETIDTNVTSIKAGTENINQKSMDGLNMSKEIIGRAETLYTKSTSAKKETLDMYQSIKSKTAQAIEKSKAVDKINELSSTIQEVANQTSLLSLNASIEAARAGESGRGFAVVAGEIGTLAEQSSTTVKGILDIVNEVHQAVDHMGECLKTTLEFLENKVMVDYNDFVEVSVQYNSDAKVVQGSMDDIHKMADNLQVAAEQIALAISGINITISDAAQGVNDIADKTNGVAASTTQVTGMVTETQKLADELEAISKTFKL
jgi:methyl-accepting chemotaxis protein